MKVNGVEISNEQLSACAAWMRNGRPFSTFTLAGFAETQGVLLERYGMDESKAPESAGNWMAEPPADEPPVGTEVRNLQSGCRTVPLKSPRSGTSGAK